MYNMIYRNYHYKTMGDSEGVQGLARVHRNYYPKALAIQGRKNNQVMTFLINVPMHSISKL